MVIAVVVVVVVVVVVIAVTTVMAVTAVAERKQKVGIDRNNGNSTTQQNTPSHTTMPHPYQQQSGSIAGHGGTEETFRCNGKPLKNKKNISLIAVFIAVYIL